MLVACGGGSSGRDSSADTTTTADTGGSDLGTSDTTDLSTEDTSADSTSPDGTSMDMPIDSAALDATGGDLADVSITDSGALDQSGDSQDGLGSDTPIDIQGDVSTNHGDLLDQSSGDLLDQSSDDLLDQSSDDLLDQSSDDLLDQSSGDLTPADEDAGLDADDIGPETSHLLLSNPPGALVFMVSARLMHGTVQKPDLKIFTVLTPGLGGKIRGVISTPEGVVAVSPFDIANAPNATVYPTVGGLSTSDAADEVTVVYNDGNLSSPTLMAAHYDIDGTKIVDPFAVGPAEIYSYPVALVTGPLSALAVTVYDKAPTSTQLLLISIPNLAAPVPIETLVADLTPATQGVPIEQMIAPVGANGGFVVAWVSSKSNLGATCYNAQRVPTGTFSESIYSAPTNDTHAIVAIGRALCANNR